MERLLSGWAEANKRNNKLIAKIKLCPIDLADYNKKVFSSGRVVISGGKHTLTFPPHIELKSDRFLPRKMIEVLYEDED